MILLFYGNVSRPFCPSGPQGPLDAGLFQFASIFSRAVGVDAARIVFIQPV
jgi:hypothetical protein